MLPRALRLSHPNDLRRVMRSGRKHSGEHMVVYTIPSSDNPRWGFVVSKAVGHAPRRNRVKRQLRAAAAEISRTSPSTLADIVVRVLPNAAQAQGNVLRAELQKLVGAV